MTTGSRRTRERPADGFFIAKEIGGDSVDLIQLFELHAKVLFDAMAHLVAGENS